MYIWFTLKLNFLRNHTEYKKWISRFRKTDATVPLWGSSICAFYLPLLSKVSIYILYVCLATFLPWPWLPRDSQGWSNTYPVIVSCPFTCPVHCPLPQALPHVPFHKPCPMCSSTCPFTSERITKQFIKWIYKLSRLNNLII